MSYQVITDFRGGLDARKFRLSLPPGTLTSLVNGHITQGGEIEKRKAFVPTSLPANTFGACPVPAGIMVFGSNTPVAIGAMPAGFFYTQLTHPDGATAMSSVVSSVLNGDYPFVIAKFADGKSFAFYNGALVNDFTSGLVMAHLNTNAKIAAALTDVVNQTGSYTAIQDPSPNDNDFDVFSQPGNSYAASLSIASTCNITVTTTDDTSFTGAILTSTNGLNAVNGTKLMLGGKNYTFKTALTPTEGEVLIGATIAATMTNLFNAINHTGTPNTDYKCAATNANLYAQNLVTAGTPTFQAVALVANVQGDVENNLAGVTYEDDAPTVVKAVAIQAIGQFKISALSPSSYASTVIDAHVQPSNNDTITINGLTITFKAGGPTQPSPAQMAIGSSAAGTMQAFVLLYNAGYWGTPVVLMAPVGGVLGVATFFSMTALIPGTSGNYTVTKSGLAWTGAPTLSLSGGTTSAITALTVGAIFAHGTLTTNGTNPADATTVTIGSVVYRFKNALAATNDIKIGANASTTLQNLIQAINASGINNVDYIIANPHPQVIALPSLNGGILQVNSRLAGIAQNSIALATTSVTLAMSSATLAGGSDSVSLISASVSSYPGQTLNDFANITIQAINAYTVTSGYTAKLIGNTVYIYAQAGNSFSNNADITVTVSGQVAIGFCAFEITNGLPQSTDSSQPAPAVNANGNTVTGVVNNLQVNGFDTLGHTHELTTSNLNTGSTTANTKAQTITGLLADIATDINANYPAAIFPFGITAVPMNGVLYLARLITTSADAPLNVVVTIKTSGGGNGTNNMSASPVTQDLLVAVVSPLLVNFVRYPIGGTNFNGTVLGAEIGIVAGPVGVAVGALVGTFFNQSVKFKTASYSPVVATCQASGGYPPYKYLWNKASGADGFNFSNQTSHSGTFTRPDNAGTNSAEWICTVTDSLGNSINSNPVRVRQP